MHELSFLYKFHTIFKQSIASYMYLLEVHMQYIHVFKTETRFNKFMFESYSMFVYILTIDKIVSNWNNSSARP